MVGSGSAEQQQQYQQSNNSNIMPYQQTHPHHSQSGYLREPLGAASPHYGGGGPMSPLPNHNHNHNHHNHNDNASPSPYNNSQPRGGRDYGHGPSPSYNTRVDAGPSNTNYNGGGGESRNYTDSQLGIAGTQPGHSSNAPQFGSPPPPGPGQQNNYRPQPQPLQQQHQHQHPPQPPYSTPRMPRHATVLKDRGSAENTSVGSDPSLGGSVCDSLGYGYNNTNGITNGSNNGRGSSSNLKVASPAIMKGRTGSHGKNLNRVGSNNTTNGGGSNGASSSTSRPLPQREMDGRHTPVRTRKMEGQVLFATPDERRRPHPSTPTAPHSEPLVRNRGGARQHQHQQHHHIQSSSHNPHNNNNHRHHQNMSPNYNRMRSPDHPGTGRGNGGYYTKNPPSSKQQQQQHNHHQQHQQQHQSKLPHGLTVQELKEMTRARLAAEADVGGPEGSSDQSVHSAGTHTSSKGSDQYSLGRGGQSGGSSNLASGQSGDSVTRNLVQSNENLRRDGYTNNASNAININHPHHQGGYPQVQQPPSGMQPPQMQQQQPPQSGAPHYNAYPRHPSPDFGAAGPGPGPNHFNGNQQPPPQPRQTSPAFGLSNSQTRSQGEAWETASAASADPGFHTSNSGGSGGNGGAGMPMPFSPPMNDSNAMTFNRTRCFSAGATAGIAGMPPPSFEQHQAAYYDHVPLAGGGNRQRCATVSPPGMSRLHEDRPFLFSTDDKERLAIPPLSEPRLRLHSTGGLNVQGAAMRAFAASVSPQPHTAPSGVAGGSAFVPIGKSDNTNNNGDRNNNNGFLPQSPPPLNIDRSKFGVGDRTISTGSAASAGHGDLPSSMAEAVLESITSTSGGAPIMGSILAGSPFRRSSEREMALGESPFRVSDDSDNASSAFRMMDHRNNGSLMPESSGSMSLFSSGENNNNTTVSSRNMLFSAENNHSNHERTLLGTHSWGGIEGDDASYYSSNGGLGHDFGNLLNLSGDNLAPLRGRAATEPVWFGGNDPLLVSRIDPEHDGEAKGPPRVSSLVDTKSGSNAPTFDYNTAFGQQQQQQGRNNFEGR